MIFAAFLNLKSCILLMLLPMISKLLTHFGNTIVKAGRWIWLSVTAQVIKDRA